MSNELDDVIWSAAGKPLTGYGGGKYRLTHEYLYFETGGLRTNAQQIPVRDVFDVDLEQTMTQKARGVATLNVHVVRPGGARETATIVDVANFREGVEAINRTSAAARSRFTQEQRTQRVSHVGGAPAAPPVNAAREDVISQLRQLGSMHHRGTLDDATFIKELHELLPRL